MIKRTAIAFCVMVTLPMSAQVQQAVALMHQARYDEAKKLLAPMTSDPEALATMAHICMIEDDAEKAAGLLEKAISLKPAVASYHFRLGSAYGNQAMKASLFGKASLAGKTRDEFEKSVQLDPNFVDARLALIDYYTMAPALMGGSPEKALSQAAEIRKRDVYQGHRAYSRIYQRQQKMDLARKEYEDGVREQPQSAKAHNVLGAFLAANDKNYRVAFEEIDTAIKLDPTYMPAYFRLGVVAGTSGAQLPRGEEALRKYLTYTPKENEPATADAHYWLGQIYEKQGKKAEAKASYAAALRYAPGSATVREALKRVS
jgi:Tfp pilus assembly protein PilF